MSEAEQRKLMLVATFDDFDLPHVEGTVQDIASTLMDHVYEDTDCGVEAIQRMVYFDPKDQKFYSPALN